MPRRLRRAIFRFAPARPARRPSFPEARLWLAGERARRPGALAAPAPHDPADPFRRRRQRPRRPEPPHRLCEKAIGGLGEPRGLPGARGKEMEGGGEGGGGGGGGVEGRRRRRLAGAAPCARARGMPPARVRLRRAAAAGLRGPPGLPDRTPFRPSLHCPWRMGRAPTPTRRSRPLAPCAWHLPAAGAPAGRPLDGADTGDRPARRPGTGRAWTGGSDPAPAAPARLPPSHSPAPAGTPSGERSTGLFPPRPAARWFKLVAAFGAACKSRRHDSSCDRTLLRPATSRRRSRPLQGA